MHNILLLLVLYILTFDLNAQEKIALPKMATQRYEKSLLDNDAAYRSRQQEIEVFTNNYTPVWTPTDIVVPVVFHLISAPGQDDIVSLEDIYAQLAQLNADFGPPNFPETPHPALDAEKFRELAAGSGIRFCLAEYDPDGKPTTGILKLNASKTAWGMTDSLKFIELGGSNAWDTEHYINIWVADQLEGNEGYAQLPGGPAQTDGIVISPRIFARTKPTDSLWAKYQKGRLLTHLMGNYLNLRELWDDEIPCRDDGVDDTPIHNAPNYRKVKYKHVSTCDGLPVTMTMNFMDIGPDEERYMFTLGQVIRMHATLAENGGPRGLLRGCGKPGGPAKTNSTMQTTTNTRLHIYPNPASDEEVIVQITGAEDAPVQVVVFDEQGRQVLTQAGHLEQGNYITRISSGTLPSGMYLVKATIGTKQLLEKLLIER